MRQFLIWLKEQNNKSTDLEIQQMVRYAVLAVERFSTLYPISYSGIVPPTMQSDLDFLNDQSKWPKFSDHETTFACLVRTLPDNTQEHGFLVETSFTVHNGYVFDGGDGTAKQYESYEQILADGWTVD
jgi:hypothetical protein